MKPLGDFDNGRVRNSKKYYKKTKAGSFIRSGIERVTTLHGLNHLAGNSARSVVSWIIIMIGNIALTTYLIIVVKERFQQNQVYTTIDATCRVNEAPFPSVSICNMNLVSKSQKDSITKILKKFGVSDTNITNFFSSLPLLQHFIYYKDWDKNLHKEELDILKRHYFSIDTIMEEVHQKCDDLLVYCDFNRHVVKCSDVFKLIKTAKGYCCAFNYAALNDVTENSVQLTIGDEFYYDDDGEVANMLSTSQSGRFTGLTVIFDVQIDDYPSWSQANYGAMVLLSDPHDFQEITVSINYALPGQSVDLKVEPLVYRTESNVRTVDVDKRNCWFSDEIRLAYTDRYSFETCMTECRMRNYIEICGCVPYKYPRNSFSRICEFADLSCMFTVIVKGLDERNCLCRLECNDKKYSVDSDVMPLIATDLPGNVTSAGDFVRVHIEMDHVISIWGDLAVGHGPDVDSASDSIPGLNPALDADPNRALGVLIQTKNLNLSTVTSLKVYYVRSNCNCYIKKLLMDFSNLIATYGGIFSLSLGGSMISILELVYIFMSFILTNLFKFFLVKCLFQ